MAETEFGTIVCQTFMAQAAARAGRFDKADAALREARRLAGEKEYMPVRLIEGYVYALAGRQREARDVLAVARRRAAHEFISPFDIASVYACLGDTDEAINCLEKSVAEREGNMIFINVAPEFDALHGHPRFMRLLERLGFTGARGVASP